VLNALGGVQYGLLNEILLAGGYMLGRSVVNMSTGLMQVAGFAIGGVLVNVLSPRGTLVTRALLYAASGCIACFGLSRRAARTAGEASVTQTWRNNKDLLASARRRYVYLGLCVPNGLVVGCESFSSRTRRGTPASCSPSRRRACSPATPSPGSSYRPRWLVFFARGGPPESLIMQGELP
jgi:hypothetical protein